MEEFALGTNSGQFRGPVEREKEGKGVHNASYICKSFIPRINLEKARETVAGDAALHVDWELVETCLFQMCPQRLPSRVLHDGTSTLCKTTVAAKGGQKELGSKASVTPQLDFRVESNPQRFSSLLKLKRLVMYNMTASFIWKHIKMG